MFWAHKKDAALDYRFHRVFFRHSNRFYEDWLDRLVVMGVIEEIDWHRENGRFFNIPECCREWYVELIDRPEAEELGKLIYTDKHFGKDDLVGYVRCPKCRILKGEIWENTND